jgi:hypothetical protein
MRVFLPVLVVVLVALLAGVVAADESTLFPTGGGGRRAIMLQEGSTAEDVVSLYGNPTYVGPSQGFATQLDQPPTTGPMAPSGMKVYGEPPKSVLEGGTRPVRIDRTVYLMYDRGAGKMIFGLDPATGIVVNMMAVGSMMTSARTSKGRTLGDSMSGVTQAYGFPERQEFTGAGLVAYFPDDNVTFTFEGLRVTGITVGKQVGVSTERQVRRVPVVQPLYGPGTTYPGTGPGILPPPPGVRPGYVPSGPQVPPMVVPPPVF